MSKSEGCCCLRLHSENRTLNNVTSYDNNLRKSSVAYVQTAQSNTLLACINTPNCYTSIVPHLNNDSRVTSVSTNTSIVARCLLMPAIRAEPHKISRTHRQNITAGTNVLSNAIATKNQWNSLLCISIEFIHV